MYWCPNRDIWVGSYVKEVKQAEGEKAYYQIDGLGDSITSLLWIPEDDACYVLALTGDIMTAKLAIEEEENNEARNRRK